MRDTQLSDSDIWDYVETFVETNGRGISYMGSKYGWISGADNNDALQDIRITCYETIRSLEAEYGDEFDLNNTRIKGLIRKRTYGRFRANNWRKRSDKFIRKSDVLNIEPGSDGDSCISYDEYIDTVGIDETSLCTTFNDSEPDAGDYFEADLEAKKILDILLQLLSEDQVIAINSVTLGNGSLGHTCHHELAEISNVSRSTITRRILSGRKFLQDFLKNNNLSLDMPRKELIERLSDIVAYYRMNKRNGRVNHQNIRELTLEDFL